MKQGTYNPSHWHLVHTLRRRKLSVSTHSTIKEGDSASLPGENSLSGENHKAEENTNTIFQTELNIPRQVFVDIQPEEEETCILRKG